MAKIQCNSKRSEIIRTRTTNIIRIKYSYSFKCNDRSAANTCSSTIHDMVTAKRRMCTSCNKKPEGRRDNKQIKQEVRNKSLFLCPHFHFTVMWSKLKNDDVLGRIQSPHFNLTSSIHITYVIQLINGLIKLTLWQYNSKVQCKKHQGHLLDTITRLSTTSQITCSSPKIWLNSTVPSLAWSFFI
jgi:hypothetical protein